MRMWMIPPSQMCRKHLLGEHVETHMFVGSIDKGISMGGYVKNNLVETHNLKARHDELVKEMQRRGYNHKSPMTYKDKMALGKVDVIYNLKDLHNRCAECKSLYKEHIESLIESTS